MNPKIRKTRRDIERAERKMAELAAEIKKLRYEKTKLEDAEIAKRVRAAAATSGADIGAILDGFSTRDEGSPAKAGESGSGVNSDDQTD